MEDYSRLQSEQGNDRIISLFCSKTDNVVKSTFSQSADEADRQKIMASETLLRVLKWKPSPYGEMLYFLHRSHSPSSPWPVPGRSSNPTLLCAEAKAQFPASKGPLFGLAFPNQHILSLNPLAFENSNALAVEDFASRFVVLNNLQKPQCEGMSIARNSFHGREEKEYYFKSSKNNFKLTL